MNETFDPALFNKLKGAEKSHFWFFVRNKWIFDTIQKLNKTPARVLEIGCGTGNVSRFLARNGYRVTGCEYYEEAIKMGWPGFDRVRCDALALPFSNEAFDVVGLFDVIEHFSNEDQILREAHRVLKKNGILVVTVPARSELWSYVDDSAFHKRRYSMADIKSALEKASYKLLSSEYMFMMLYFPMKILRRKEGKASDQFKINKAVNFMSLLYFEFERLISRFIKLPIGTSIIAVAKK